MRHRVQKLGKAEANELLADLEARKWRIFCLDGSEIVDRSTLCDAVRKALPLAPPLYGDYNWDGFSDSIFGGIDLLELNKIAIVWTDSENMSQPSSEDFQMALTCLADVSEQLCDPVATAGSPKDLRIIVV